MGSSYFGGGKLALVVDDQPDFCTAMEHLLATLGFRATCAGDGIEALVRLQNMSPAVILLDLFMPRMDGIELLRLLQSSEKSVPPIIAVTGDARATHHSVGRAAESLGAKAFLLKPFTRDELATAISSVFEKPDSTKTH